jgi:hypothetical protein
LCDFDSQEDFMKSTQPVIVCDILQRPLKKGETARPYQVGDKIFEDVSEEAIAKIQAFVAKLGVPKAPRKAKAKDETPTPAAQPAPAKTPAHGQEIPKK